MVAFLVREGAMMMLLKVSYFVEGIFIFALVARTVTIATRTPGAGINAFGGDKKRHDQQNDLHTYRPLGDSVLSPIDIVFNSST